MTKIATGIYCLEVPLRLQLPDSISVYVIKNGKECAIVDTGFDTEDGLESLTRQLKEIDHPDKTDITQIIATHAHGDHYGMAGTLGSSPRQKLPCTTWKRSPTSGCAKYSRIWGLLEQWFTANGAPPSKWTERWGHGPSQPPLHPPG